ncbi:hypothetical protein [Algisphaera agarilytica]|uniref:Uncharacterized protein n=1 Tax=Algisphaera agarilytica TaxID=1385975 RepID=A0A7X0H674_9BACT|nr:hypothetical protein [Algisphaera agarilytica]MBB6428841.1 hypothetical protein [Algisphaera agarilytica]
MTFPAKNGLLITTPVPRLSPPETGIRIIVLGDDDGSHEVYDIYDPELPEKVRERVINEDRKRFGYPEPYVPLNREQLLKAQEASDRAMAERAAEDLYGHMGEGKPMAPQEEPAMALV